MVRFVKRVLQDIFSNFFLSLITLTTISFSVLMISAFALFFVNATEILRVWTEGIRIMAYLKPDLSEKTISRIQHDIERMDGIRQVIFISKLDALERLKHQMGRQLSLFDGLKINPLPDAFEIQMIESFRNLENIESIAERIESINAVDEVEYGKKWLGRFTHILKLFKMATYVMAGIFFMAAMFFVANTVRLLLYSRRQEVELLRLVGATDSFIKYPFYFQGIMHGALGGIIGIGISFCLYLYVATSVKQGDFSGIFQIQYLDGSMIILVILGSIFVGWFGCFVSLRQFLK